MTESPADTRRRVAAYIDGFNVYHGLIQSGWGRHRWLDYSKLIESFVSAEERLLSLNYFTSLRNDHEQLERQNRYLDALRRTGGVTVTTGWFANRPTWCPLCKNTFPRPQEKESDVNFATQLVADAHDNLFDIAIIVCGDSDLVPAVRHVRSRFGKVIRLIDPPGRPSEELATLADDHLHFIESNFSAAQLPNPVTYHNKKGKARYIYRPDQWV